MMKTIIRSLFCYLFIVGNTAALAQSTAAILPQGKTQFLDNNGKPLSAGKVFFYIPSTTTFKTTWQDAAETTPNANPVILDAGGRAIIYGSGTYRQIVRDSANNTIYDAVTASAGSGGGTTGTGDGDLVGTIKPWAGLVAPNQYAFAYGQEISRTTYAAYFTATTLTQNISCTSGSPILTGLSDTTQIPAGSVIETTCMPAGSAALSKTSTTVTMNTNASLTTSTTGRFFLYGNGNGATTFNVPDLRGQIIAGRTNMGGTASTNLTSTYFGTPFGQSPDSTGAKGGLEYSQLATPNLPPYTPAGTPSHTPMGTINTPTITINYSGSSTLANYAAGGGGIGGGGTGNTTTISATSSGLTFTGTTTAGSFVGVAQGGTSTRFPLIQPTMTLNYIVKITPDQNSADASGVTSLGLMTGDIACGVGLICTGNIISTSTAALWAANGNDIYNANTGSVLIGTSTAGTGKLIVTDDVSATNVVLDVHSKNAVYSMALGFPGQFARIYSGSAANPITTVTPTVSISRREALTIDAQGGQNSALYVESLGNDVAVGSSPNPQPVAGTFYAQQLGLGDAVGVYGNANQSGTPSATSYAAFGVNGQCGALVAGTSCIGVASATQNGTGTNQTYLGGGALGRSRPNTIGYDTASIGANRATVGMYVHGPWDVGIAFDKTPTGVVTTDIQDNTSAITILLDQGTHTNGIDLRSGTYSGSPYLSTGFNVDATGNVSAKALSHTSSIFIGSTSGQITLNATAIAGVNTILLPAASGTLALSAGAAIPTIAQGDLLFGSATNTLSALAKNTSATRYLSNTGTTNNPAWAQIDLTNGVTGRLPFANEQQGLANSVRANCTASTADITNVQAGAADQVFRVGSGSNPCAWGAINLASTNAVTGILAVANGGTGDAGTAWTPYTPTLSCGTGTFTSASATGASKQTGKTILVRVVVSITTNGSCAGRVEATLPINVSVGLGDQTLAGFNATSASVLAATIAPAVSISKVLFFSATGTYPGASANELVAQGVYEVP